MAHSFTTLFRSASRLPIATHSLPCSDWYLTVLLAPGFPFPASAFPGHFRVPTVLSLNGWQYRNLFEPVVHRLRDSRPRLRPQLTQSDSRSALRGMETLDIRPGNSVLSPYSRYSFRHSLFHAVHSSLRYCFFPHAMLLYQPFGSLVSVARFSPGHFRRRTSRPVSYYALFEWMAASEPTSWLSSKSHILFHLNRFLFLRVHSSRDLNLWVWALFPHF